MSFALLPQHLTTRGGTQLQNLLMVGSALVVAFRTFRAGRTQVQQFPSETSHRIFSGTPMITAMPAAIWLKIICCQEICQTPKLPRRTSFPPPSSWMSQALETQLLLRELGHHGLGECTPRAVPSNDACHEAPASTKLLDRAGASGSPVAHLSQSSPPAGAGAVICLRAYGVGSISDQHARGGTFMFPCSKGSRHEGELAIESYRWAQRGGAKCPCCGKTTRSRPICAWCQPSGPGKSAPAHGGHRGPSSFENRAAALLVRIGKQVGLKVLLYQKCSDSRPTASGCDFA